MYTHNTYTEVIYGGYIDISYHASDGIWVKATP